MPQLRIGPLAVSNNLVLAPMAGITNLPFRSICREEGAGLFYSEMISAEALVHKNPKTRLMLDTDPREEPLVYQLCGGRKEALRDAVHLLQEGGARIIDLNLGCPVPKIAKSGGGAALARNPLLVEEILKEMVKAARVPVTLKLRKGWDDASVNCLDICRRAQDLGISMIALHGRTAKQGYGGKADWDIIREARKILSIPLVGNGDVNTPEDAKIMLEFTGCAGVMIGRASMGNPWIFKETLHYLETGERLPPPSGEERVGVMLRHLRSTVEKFGEPTGVRMMRKFWGHYVKERPGAARLRDTLVHLETEEAVRRAILDFF